MEKRWRDWGFTRCLTLQKTKQVQEGLRRGVIVIEKLKRGSLIIGLGVFREARRWDTGGRVQVFWCIGQALLFLNPGPLPSTPPEPADGASLQQQQRWQQHTIPFLIYIQRANFSPGRQGETPRSSGAKRCQT